jgi:hypothetical protein
MTGCKDTGPQSIEVRREASDDLGARVWFTALSLTSLTQKQFFLFCLSLKGK